MRIGFISTRLNGTDGVSLEVEKWATILAQLGHELCYCAGELGGYAAGGTLIPRLHFEHPVIVELNQRAFGAETTAAEAKKLSGEIQAAADALQEPLRAFINAQQIDLLIVENAFAIPMNLPLGLALRDLISDLGIKTIAHNHDFYWERQRFQNSAVIDLLDTAFPADLPSIRHATINSIAQRRLKRRRGIDSIVVPNVHDFATPPPAIDDFNQDFREALNLSPDEPFILQPTRVIQRKGIEMALELVHALDVPEKRLFITHRAGDEGVAYWQWLQHEARMLGVDLRLVDHLIGSERAEVNGRKIYSLWDAYPQADLVTYPSLYEGFGNALLEAIYFKRLILINRYAVYNADIGPLGFEFIELDGFVDDAAVAKTEALLKDPARVQAMAENNYALAHRHFSYQVLERKLAEMIASF